MFDDAGLARGGAAGWGKLRGLDPESSGGPPLGASLSIETNAEKSLRGKEQKNKVDTYVKDRVST